MIYIIGILKELVTFIRKLKNLEISQQHDFMKTSITAPQYAYYCKRMALILLVHFGSSTEVKDEKEGKKKETNEYRMVSNASSPS